MRISQAYALLIGTLRYQNTWFISLSWARIYHSSNATLMSNRHNRLSKTQPIPIRLKTERVVLQNNNIKWQCAAEEHYKIVLGQIKALQLINNEFVDSLAIETQPPCPHVPLCTLFPFRNPFMDHGPFGSPAPLMIPCVSTPPESHPYTAQLISLTVYLQYLNTHVHHIKYFSRLRLLLVKKSFCSICPPIPP